MALIVQKYGGTSVGSIERIKNVAQKVKARQEEGNQLVVVLSAMSGVTNSLIDLAHEISPQPDLRELDVLMATGEQQSVALFCMAAKDLGIHAHSLLGFQASIKTDNMFGRARIASIDTARIMDMLNRNVLVVVAGFQGLDVHGDVTTLGRGGSDTTAVALAAALQADVCEIYTDVEGVYTADPNMVPSARKMDKISYEEMLEMASLGAKVLDIRSVAMAAKFGVHVHVRSTFSDREGTMVVPEKLIDEKLMVSGVTYSKNDARIRITGVPDMPGIAYKLFNPIAEAGIVVDVILQNISQDGLTDMTFTVPRPDFQRTMDLINNKILSTLNAHKVEGDPNIAKVSVVGIGMRNHSGVATKMFNVLCRENINIQMITTSEIKISCVIDAKYVELAVRSLHNAFGLDADNPPQAEQNF